METPQPPRAAPRHWSPGMATPRLPTKLMLEPTSRCNLKCPLCVSGLGQIPKKSDMTLESFVDIYDQLELGCRSVTFHNFGEPLLNRQVPAMIAHAKRNGCAWTGLSSNATLLTERWCEALTTCGLDHIWVCVDGLTQETYGRYRIGGKLAKVLEGIRRLVRHAKEKGSPLEIAMQFIVFKHNEHELEDVRRFAEDLGVHQLDIKISGSATRTPEFRPAEEEHLAVNRSGMRSGPLCHWVYETIVVNCDGHVMPCCWAGHNPVYSMGNVFHHSVEEIWNTERYRRLRENVASRENLWKMCRDKCLNGPQSRHIVLPLET